MTTVTLSYPNGRRVEIILDQVPRKGESIQRTNGPEARTLIVEHVIWLEGSGENPDPGVLLLVRPHPDAPAV